MSAQTVALGSLLDDGRRRVETAINHDARAKQRLPWGELNFQRLSELLTLIVTERDREAYDVLSSLLEPRIRALGLQQGLGLADAEELARETMLSVCRGTYPFPSDPPGVPAWLNSMTRGCRANVLLMRDIDHDNPWNCSNSRWNDDEIELAKPSAQLDDEFIPAIAELSVDQRQVITKQLFENKSYHTIARELDLPLSTVQWWSISGLSKMGLTRSDGAVY